MNTTISRDTLVRIQKAHRRRDILFWAIGIFSALVGLGMAVSPSFSFGSARTEGTVIEVVSAVGTVNSYPDAYGVSTSYPVAVYYPVVEYQVDGRQYNRMMDSGFRTYTAGQKIPVLYQVDRPEVVRIDSFSERWLGRLMVGGGLVVGGLFMMAILMISNRMLRKVEVTVTEKIQGVERNEGLGQIESN